jgi:hypothetical protein
VKKAKHNQTVARRNHARIRLPETFTAL